jgi:hypothetical protein
VANAIANCGTASATQQRTYYRMANGPADQRATTGTEAGTNSSIRTPRNRHQHQQTHNDCDNSTKLHNIAPQRLLKCRAMHPSANRPEGSGLPRSYTTTI